MSDGLVTAVLSLFGVLFSIAAGVYLWVNRPQRAVRDDESRVLPLFGSDLVVLDDDEYEDEEEEEEDAAAQPRREAAPRSATPDRAFMAEPASKAAGSAAADADARMEQSASAEMRHAVPRAETANVQVPSSSVSSPATASAPPASRATSYPPPPAAPRPSARPAFPARGGRPAGAPAGSMGTAGPMGGSRSHSGNGTGHGTGDGGDARSGIGGANDAHGHSVRFSVPTDGTLQFLPGRLEIVSGEDTGREIRFVRFPGPTGSDITFGRNEGEPYRHVQLRDQTVSRLHARMRMVDGAWVLTNLSTTNPVAHNGRVLGEQEEQPLADDDRVEMGAVVFRFRSR